MRQRAFNTGVLAVFGEFRLSLRPRAANDQRGADKDADRARRGAGAQIRDQLRDMRLWSAIQKDAFRVLRGKIPPAI